MSEKPKYPTWPRWACRLLRHRHKTYRNTPDGWWIRRRCRCGRHETAIGPEFKDPKFRDEVVRTLEEWRRGMAQ